MRKPYDFSCVDCGLCTRNEGYMVHDKIWLEAGMLYPRRYGDGNLCIGCLEDRLGRQLVPDDFPDYPINDIYYHAAKSERLISRLQGVIA